MLRVLFCLFLNSFSILQWGYNDARMDITVTLAKLLIKYGCSPKAKSTQRHTAIMLALAKVRIIDLIIYRSFQCFLPNILTIIEWCQCEKKIEPSWCVLKSSTCSSLYLFRLCIIVFLYRPTQSWWNTWLKKEALWHRRRMTRDKILYIYWQNTVRAMN